DLLVPADRIAGAAGHLRAAARARSLLDAPIPSAAPRGRGHAPRRPRDGLPRLSGEPVVTAVRRDLDEPALRPELVPGLLGGRLLRARRQCDQSAPALL